MLETLFGIESNSAITILGVLSFASSVIVEVLKNVLPKKFPTKLLTIIVSLLISIVFVLGFVGISFKLVIGAIFMGFVVAFVSMNGFDTFKDLKNRFVKGGEE